MDAFVELELSFSQARRCSCWPDGVSRTPIHKIAKAIGLSDAATGRNIDQLVKLGIVERRERRRGPPGQARHHHPDRREVSLQHIESKRTAIKAMAADSARRQPTSCTRASTDILAGETLRRHTHQEN